MEFAEVLPAPQHLFAPVNYIWGSPKVIRSFISQGKLMLEND